MADVTIRINAQDNATPTLNNISKAVSALGSAGSAVASVAAAGIVTMAAATVAIGGAIAGLTVAAAPIENLRAAFDGFAESAGVSGSAMLAALQEASGGLINMESIMTSFNLAAQLMGTTLAARLPEAIGALGAVAAATGTDMDFLLNSLVTGVSRLSKPILDNLGVVVDMEAAYQDWADANDRVVDSLTETEKRAAVFDEVVKQLNENTKNIPDIMDSAAARMDRFKVTLQDLGVIIGTAFIPILERALDVFEPLFLQVVDTAIPILLNFADALDTFFVRLENLSFLNAFKGLISDLFPPEAAQNINTFLENLRPLQNLLDGVGDPIENIQDLLTNFGIPEGVAEGIGNVLEALEGLSEIELPDLSTLAAPDLSTFISEVGAFTGIDPAASDSLAQLPFLLDSIGAAAKEVDLSGLVDPIKEGLDGLITEVTPALEEFGATISTTFSTVVIPMFVASFAEVTASIEENAPGFSDALAVIGESIGTALQDIGVVFAAALPIIGEIISTGIIIVATLLQGIVTAVLGIATAVINIVNGDWTAAFQALVGVVVTIGESIAEAIVVLLEGIATIFGTSLSEIGATWSNNWNMFKTIVSTIFDNIIIAISEKIAAIALTISTTAITISTAWSTIWNAMVTSVETALTNVATAVSTGISTAVGIVTGFVGDFVSAGAALADGIISGVKSVNLIAFFNGLVGDVIAAVKALLGISSPSKVFAGIGSDMMRGMQFGVDMNAFRPQMAVASATQGVVSSAISSGSFGGGFGGGGVNNFTITNQPGISFGAEADAVDTLIPLIQRAMELMSDSAPLQPDTVEGLS